MILLYFFVPVKAKYFVIGYVVLEVLAVGGASNVAHLAHLGGAAMGLLYLLVEDKLPIDAIFDRIGGLFKRAPAPRVVQGGRKVDATYEDLPDDDDAVTQEMIDRILDKISKSGYQNLTEREKKILFEASKKIH
jgi:hypothetical protein